MRRTIGCVALTVALAVSGCARGRAEFRSTLERPLAKPLERLLVLARVKNKAFNEDLWRGFRSGLTKGFLGCGLKASAVEHPEDLESEKEWAGRVARARAELRPDAVLILRGTGGDVVIGRYGTNSDLHYDLGLLEPEAKDPFWSARAKYSVLTRNLYVDDQASGERFATEIVKRLEADGVLKGCRWPQG